METEVFSKVVLMGKSKVGKTRLIKSFRTTFPDDNKTICNVYNLVRPGKGGRGEESASQGGMLSEVLAQRSRPPCLSEFRIKESLFGAVAEFSHPDHNIKIWDTSDNASLEKQLPCLLCKANLIVLVFDTGKPQSLAYLMKYIKEIKKLEESYKVIILGHHLTRPRCVKYSGGKMLADTIGAEYIECEDDLQSDFFCSYLAKTIVDQHGKTDDNLHNFNDKSRMDRFKNIYMKLD